MAKHTKTKPPDPAQPARAIHGPQAPLQVAYGVERLRRVLGLTGSDVGVDVLCQEAAVRLENSTGSKRLRDPLDPA